MEFLRHPPPAAEPRFWDYAPGQRLAWNEFGDPDGAPVMYYHGWPSSRLQARLTHHLASDRALRIVAMDRPGMGKSTYLPGRRLDVWPEMMEGFADSLGIGRFGQLGVSGGSPYVLACAAKIPHRLTKSAVLAGAVPLGECRLHGLHPLYRILIFLRNRMPCAAFSAVFRLAELATRLNPARPPMSWLLRSVSGEDRRVLLANPDLWAVIVKSFQAGVHDARGRGVMGDANIYFERLNFDFQDISHPIRYWHGADDRNIPLELVQEFVGKIPHAQLEIVDDLGHFSLVIHRASAALDYLAEVPG